MNTTSPGETATCPVPTAGLLIKKKPLAALLGVSGRTIDAWVARRVIPYIAASPRMHLFDPEAVKKALSARFGVEAVAHRVCR